MYFHTTAHDLIFGHENRMSKSTHIKQKKVFCAKHTYIRLQFLLFEKTIIAAHYEAAV